MKLKHVLWATAGWTLVIVAASVLIITLIFKNAPRAEMEQRTGMAGTATATVALIGYAAIWLPFCVKVGKRRREAQERAKREEQERARQVVKKKKRPPTA